MVYGQHLWIDICKTLNFDYDLYAKKLYEEDEED